MAGSNCGLMIWRITIALTTNIRSNKWINTECMYKQCRADKNGKKKVRDFLKMHFWSADLSITHSVRAPSSTAQAMVFRHFYFVFFLFFLLPPPNSFSVIYHYVYNNHFVLSHILLNAHCHWPLLMRVEYIFLNHFMPCTDRYSI